MLLTDKISQLLNCRVNELRDKLNHPEDRERVIQILNGQVVQTTYPDRNGLTKTFVIGGLTQHGAASTMAYGKLARTYNATVCAHYYIRHRIKLRHPYLHCVIEKFPNGQEDRYYPLELCKLLDNEPKSGHLPTWLGKAFAEIKSEIKESTIDDDMDSIITDTGRHECTQTPSTSYRYW